MEDGGSITRREQGWRGPILALVALILIPFTPFVPVIVPIEQAVVLLIPAIAACAVAAWWRGGRAALAILWIALAGWTLSRPALGASPGFDALTRGWSLVVAGGFGAVVCFGRLRSFLGRAVTTVILAFVAAIIILNFSGRGGLRDTVSAELAQRSDRTVEAIETTMASSPRWAAIIARDTTPAAFASQMEASLDNVASGALVVFPALLALESIAILALAWAFFNRLSRVRVGAPLAPLRDFRFNDQLVWGVLLAITAILLPTLDGFRAAGWNLLVFFGGLYAIRGLGVMAWFLTPGRLAFAVAVLLLFMFPLLGVLTFGIGIGDTWVDWRNRARTPA